MSVRISVESGALNRVSPEAIGVIVAGKNVVSEGLGAQREKQLAAVAKTHGVEGGFAAATVTPVTGVSESTAIFLGLGSAEDMAQQAESLRRACGTMVMALESIGVKHATISLQGVERAPELAAAIADGVQLAAYTFTEHSPRRAKESKQKALRSVTLLVGKNVLAEARRAVNAAKALDKGVGLARDLVNHPPYDMSPAKLVEVATDIAKQGKHISISTMDRAQSERAGFSAFLSVAKGSDLEPFVIHLEYKPENPTGSVAVVGKGITFDSGGLSLKPAQYMETMKCDMAGAATVLGLFAALEAIKPTVAVHGIIAACENMPSGTAYRPGDVVTARNGRTIEIRNTDAEGRVTLADALSYAVEQQPDAIIDLATLTGACVVALGESVAGLFTEHYQLGKALKDASKKTGEQIAQLPMPVEYNKQIRSEVGDIRNDATSRYGGAITAALFLKEFVGDTPWAHIDIAGPSFMESSVLPYYRPGGTGFGVRLLAETLRSGSLPAQAD